MTRHNSCGRRYNSNNNNYGGSIRESQHRNGMKCRNGTWRDKDKKMKHEKAGGGVVVRGGDEYTGKVPSLKLMQTTATTKRCRKHIFQSQVRSQQGCQNRIGQMASGAPMNVGTNTRNKWRTRQKGKWLAIRKSSISIEQPQEVHPDQPPSGTQCNWRNGRCGGVPPTTAAATLTYLETTAM